jgi:hypothetical protein
MTGSHGAVLECGTEIGLQVMVRPLEAAKLLHQQMGAMLDRMKPGRPRRRAGR